VPFRRLMAQLAQIVIFDSNVTNLAGVGQLRAYVFTCALPQSGRQE
jgi:hypothetical protein